MSEERAFRNSLLESAREDTPPPDALVRELARLGLGPLPPGGGPSGGESAPKVAGGESAPKIATAGKTWALKWAALAALGAGVVVAAGVSRHAASDALLVPVLLAPSAAFSGDGSAAPSETVARLGERTPHADSSRADTPQAATPHAEASQEIPPAAPTTAPSLATAQRERADPPLVRTTSTPPADTRPPMDDPSEARGTHGTTGFPTGAPLPAPPTTTPDSSDLAKEVALVDDARFYAASNPDRALRILDERKARFPNGAFSVEARLLRIEILVTKGDLESARAEAAPLLRDRPDSPAARRARALLTHDRGPTPSN